MNRLSWYLSLAPLMAIVIYYLGSSLSSQPPAPTTKAHQAGVGQIMTQIAKAGGESATKLQAHSDEPSDTLKEAIRRSDASSKKLATYLTPELRASLINGLLKKRSAQYQELFDSWQIDQSVRDEILSIVREREVQLSNHRYNLFANGRASTNVYVANKLFDESLSQMQLARLLGKARYEEFSKLEAQMFQVEHPNIGRRKTDG